MGELKEIEKEEPDKEDWNLYLLHLRAGCFWGGGIIYLCKLYKIYLSLLYSFHIEI